MEKQDISCLSSRYVIIPISFDNVTYRIVVSALTKNSHTKFYTNLKFFIQDFKKLNVNKLIRPKDTTENIARLSNANFKAYYSSNSLGSWCTFELLEILNLRLHQKHNKTRIPTKFTRYLKRNIKYIYNQYKQIKHKHTLRINEHERIRTTNEHFVFINDLTHIFKTDIRNFFKTTRNKDYLKANSSKYISGTKNLDELNLRVTFAHPSLAKMVLDWIVKKDKKKGKTYSSINDIEKFIDYHLDNIDSEQKRDITPIDEISDYSDNESVGEPEKIEEPKSEEITSNVLSTKGVAHFKLKFIDNSFTTIPVRKEDGYINATALCKAGNRKFNDYKRLKDIDEVLEAISLNTGIPVIKLMEVEPGRYGGTWVHRRVAYHMAIWASPIFGAVVGEWLDHLLLTGKVELGKEKSQKELESYWKDMINPLKSLDIYDEKDVVYLFRFEPVVELMDEEIDENKMYMKYGKTEG